MQIEGSVRPKLALHILSTPLVLPLKTVSFQNCPSALLKCPSAGRGLPVTPNSSVEAKGQRKAQFLFFLPCLAQTLAQIQHTWAEHTS